MRTVEERAQDFVSSGEHSPSLKECYIAGAADEHPKSETNKQEIIEKELAINNTVLNNY